MTDPPDPPSDLDTPSLRAALKDWYDYRRERRMPMTAVGWRRMYAKFDGFNSEQIIQAIGESIDRGYRGCDPAWSIEAARRRVGDGMTKSEEERYRARVAREAEQRRAEREEASRKD